MAIKYINSKLSLERIINTKYRKMDKKASNIEDINKTLADLGEGTEDVLST